MVFELESDDFCECEYCEGHPKQIYYCEMCQEDFKSEKNAEKCEEHHRKTDDFHYANYLFKINREKLDIAANQSGQTTLRF